MMLDLGDAMPAPHIHRYCTVLCRVTRMSPQSPLSNHLSNDTLFGTGVFGMYILYIFLCWAGVESRLP